MKKLWTQWKRRWLPYVVAYSAKFAIRQLLRTCQVHIHGLDHLTENTKASPCILALWHDKLILVSEILNSYTSGFPCTAFISKSRDGDPLALVTTSYSRGRVLRVPHNARHKALSTMIDILKRRDGIVLITPDGPRGPRHIVKPGIVLAAREASAKVIPFSWKASRYWQLSTWDKMQIPKPFSTLHVTFGSPVDFSGTEDMLLDSDLEMLKNHLEGEHGP